MDEPWWRRYAADFAAVLAAAQERGSIKMENVPDLALDADLSLIEELLTLLHERGVHVIEDGEAADDK
jgi:hypothetical protein